MAPDAELTRRVSDQFKSGEGVDVVIAPNGDAQIILKVTEDVAKGTLSQLEAERNGIPLVEYFRSHAITVATFEELEEQEKRDKPGGVTHGDKPSREAEAKYNDNDGLDIYYFDDRSNLRFITLPFANITEFIKAPKTDGGGVEGPAIRDILTRGGFKQVSLGGNFDYYQKRAEDVEKHREIAGTPQIEF
ncbi:MAG: hypothetical protein WC873_03515 [Candidatus Gracilibacteria bacterium]